jgi:hypothetical protein
MRDHDALRRLLRWRGAVARMLTLGICAGLGLLVIPPGASATSITDVGEGFPTSMNASDQMAIGKLSFEENPETDELEENIEGPWSIWNGGNTTKLLPLNGPGEGKEGEDESPRHEILDVLDINSAGQVAGTSTVSYTEKDEERSNDRPAWYSLSGQGHEVPLLVETLLNENGESIRAGGLGVGIDDKGDVVGEDAINEMAYGKEVAVARGFFAPGGSNPVVVGEADRPSGPWGSEVFEVNGEGTMFGRVFEYNDEGEPSNEKFYLWKSPSEAGTQLNFDKPVRGLASDGSILGERAGVLYLRSPEGETAVTGLKNPYALNAAHEVVGSETVSGVEHAAVWKGGTVTDLNTLLPKGSGWVLQRATAINDGGDIAGIGTHEGKAAAFLLKPSLAVTSTEDEKESSTAGAGLCATEKDGCTLRAAIETVDKGTSDTPTSVTFDIAKVPAGTLAKISPASPLPPITKPISIDATTQPEAFTAGSRTIGAIIDGTNAGTGNGLELAQGSAGSTVAGLQIQHFKGDGVKLADENEQLADSVLTDDTTGAEVAANNDTVGAANGLAGDIFFTDGDVKGLTEYLESHGGNKRSVAEFQSALATYGSGILLTATSTGASITGDYIGVHGPGFESAPDKLGADGPLTKNLAGDETIMPFGVVIAPTSGPISNVTVGGPGGAADVDSGTIFGLLALAGEGGAVNGLSIQGSSFGAATNGSALEPLGGLIGVLAAGAVNGLQIGTPTAGDKFQGLLIGAALAGEQVSSPSVQGDTFGTNANLGSFETKLGLHDVFGLLLADTQGATIGGTSSGQGNSILGTLIGLGLVGQHLANDTIADNTIGSSSPARFTTFLKAELEEFYGVLGVLFSGNAKPGASNSSQNITFQSNAIQGNMFGMLSVATTGMSLYGNTVQDNAFGLFDLGSGGAQIGSSGRGNAFVNDGFGLLMANTDPSPDELKEAEVNPKDSSPSTREGVLGAPDENLAFDGVNAITTANLSPTSANPPSVPGTNNSIFANNFGVNSAGSAEPNELPVLIAGDEHSLQFGGTAPGQGNTVEDNRDAGVWVAGGEDGHNPTVQILGNTIYNNENFTGTLTGFPGLGIDLINYEGVGAFGPIGVDPEDPTQPDVGANNLQNSPKLSAASSSGGTLTLTGSLHGVAGTNYLIEVFADENQNPFGAGEGETLLGRLSLTTNAAGNIEFTATFAAPGAGYRFISSTATTVPASGPGVTSEFSVNVPITMTPPSPTTSSSTAGTATTPAATTTTTPKGAATTTVSASGSSATTTSPSVTLPVVVSCSSATATPCTVTTTATVPPVGASKATVTATVANSKQKKGKKGKAPLTIGHGSMTLVPGASAPLHLTLSGQGLALLRADHTLAITITVTITGAGRPTITHTLHFQLKFKQPAKAKPKHGSNKPK